MGISWLVSDFMGRGVENWEAVEAFRRGVGAALRSFFLWERVPLFVSCGAVATVLGEARTIGVAGVEETGCNGRGTDEERASKSERWFAKVFWDWRILRTAGVTLPWLTVELYMSVRSWKVG
jgi:hypothetical protein